MNGKIMKLSYPLKSLDSVNTFSETIPASAKDIYKAVNFFEKNIFSDKINLRIEKTGKKIPLREIINLHNNNGIKDISQIKEMAQNIKSGDDIFDINRMPNIKLVRTAYKEWVLFDGHHSMLAYMVTGKKYLHEVPYLVIEDEKKGYVSDEEILVFFGEHSKKIIVPKWREYVINWQNPVKKQLCKRIQKNMGELFESLNMTNILG